MFEMNVQSAPLPTTATATTLTVFRPELLRYKSRISVDMQDVDSLRRARLERPRVLPASAVSVPSRHALIYDKPPFIKREIYLINISSNGKAPDNVKLLRVH